MIIQTTAVDVEIEHDGESYIFQDVDFCARVMSTDPIPASRGIYEFGGEPGDLQVVSLSVALTMSMDDDLPESLTVAVWYEQIKKILIARIYSGEFLEFMKDG